FTTFRADPGFAREFPHAVQTGPLWPRRFRPAPGRAGERRRREWVWYASPASAVRIASAVVAGLADARPPVHLYLRTGRPWSMPLPADRVEVAHGPIDPVRWHRRWASAELRIVTGSRTLLEAIEHGGPFLYFNGVLGTGARQRRHRPEKVVALLDVARSAGVSASLRRDLADFASGRRVEPVVRAAVSRADGWRRFPRTFRTVGFRPPYDDAGHLLGALARSLARDPSGAEALVARVRSGSPL
ncbi:MAG: hypothetical protein ACREDE_06120, partial [Thermoplasmata archaeon]